MAAGTSVSPPSSFWMNPTPVTSADRGESSGDRRYWEIFARSHGSVWNAFPNTNLDGPCPFAYDMQQPMRNLAIARGLEQEDMVERAWFALCAHDANPDITMHWENWKRLIAHPSMAPSLRASEVVAIGEADGLKDWAAYMRARYRL